MKVSELRIGNLVESLTGHQAPVCGITNESISLIIAKDVKLDYTAYDGDLINDDIILSSNVINLKPIPLTEEWLVKLGFKLAEGDAVWEDCKLSYFDKVYWITGMYFLEIDDDEFRFHLATDEDTYMMLKYNVEYVHELQNLYYALTGEEL